MDNIYAALNLIAHAKVVFRFRVAYSYSKENFEHYKTKF